MNSRRLSKIPPLVEDDTTPQQESDGDAFDGDAFDDAVRQLLEARERAQVSNELARYENLLDTHMENLPQRAELSAELFGVRRTYQDSNGDRRVADRQVIGTLNHSEMMERFREAFEESLPEERDLNWLTETFAHCLTYNFTDRRGIEIQFMPNAHQRSFDHNPMCTGCYDFAALSPFEDEYVDTCGMDCSSSSEQETPQE